MEKSVAANGRRADEAGLAKGVTHIKLLPPLRLDGGGARITLPSKAARNAQVNLPAQRPSAPAQMDSAMLRASQY